MKKLGDYYSMKGQTHRWVKIKADAVRIQKKRDLKAKQKAKRSEEDEILIKQLGIIFISMIGAVAVIAGIVFLIFRRLMRNEVKRSIRCFSSYYR